MLPRRGPSITHSRNPSSDLSHVGRADAPKKESICQVIERLPRIARLPHLKTQTPRTPRTPRATSSTTTAQNKRVGRRWPPPGGLQLNSHSHSDKQIESHSRHCNCSRIHPNGCGCERRHHFYSLMFHSTSLNECETSILPTSIKAQC